MDTLALQRIKTLFGQGRTAEAADVLLDYCRAHSPEAEEDVLLLKKNIADYERAFNQGLGPDPALRNRAEKELLEIVRQLQNPAQAPADPGRALRRSLAHTAWAAWNFASHPIVWVFPLVFGVCYFLGKRHAENVNDRFSLEAFYTATISQRAHLQWQNEERTAFALRYACGGSTIYSYSPEQGLDQQPMLVADAAQLNTAAVVLNAPVQAYAVGGAIALYVFSPTSFWQAFQGLLKSHSNNVAQKLLVVLAAGSGYLYGYHRHIRKEPSCHSPEMQAYLQDEAFWAQLYEGRKRGLEASKQVMENLRVKE
jgi:hypothetical protein